VNLVLWLSALSTLFSTAPVKPARPLIWTVHVDRAAPGDAGEFEKLHDAQTTLSDKILREHQVPAPSTYKIRLSDFTYITLRPRKSFAELDGPSKTPTDVQKILAERVDPLDEAIHATLIDHFNQIWQLDGDDVWVPPGREGKIPGSLHIRSEWVKPSKLQAYGDVLGKLREALEKTKTPVGLLPFYVWYGEGGYRLVWFGESREQLARLKSPEQIFVEAFGKDEGRELAKTWRDCVSRVADSDGEPRLGGGDPSGAGWIDAARLAPSDRHRSRKGEMMKRVTGIGGIFFKSKDHKGLQAWYREHLGIEPGPGGSVAFEWRDKEKPDEVGMTVWSVFPSTTKYLDPSSAPFMVNYRVENLAAVLEALRAEGVTVDEKVDESEYGKFGWVMDPDGNRIELWEPPPAR